MKLTRDDWLDAAYEAMLSGGPNAVAVATLSKQLGATRGSFYHYFDDREALLTAVLLRWEHAAVDAFIHAASTETDPARRLDRLLSQVFRAPTALAAGERHMLAARNDDGLLAATVERVIQRRHAFLADCYHGLGHPPGDAQDRALVAYTMFTGWLYLDQTARPDPAATDRVVELIRHLLLNDEPNTT